MAASPEHARGDRHALGIDTAAGLDGTALVPAGLPHDLAAQVPARLRFGAFAAAGVFTLALLSEPLRPAGAALQPVALVAELLGVALSLGVARFARTARLSQQAFTDVALAFEVAVGLILWIGELSVPLATTTHTPGIPTVCGWMLFFPLLVPLPTRAAVLAAGLLTLAGPMTLVSFVAAGQPAPQLSHAAVWFLPAALSAVASVLTADVLRAALLGLRQARRRDHYELVRRLGQGGMGELYVARHARLARLAAVKRIRADLFRDHDPDMITRLQQRFEVEARTIARLRSPHTVELYDFGVAEDGALYYAMELLDGVDLQQLVERTGPQPPARVVHLLLQAAESLAEAHGLGLVHRDIKPSNLMLCRLGLRHDVLKVLDFGMVKVAEGADHALHTRAGAWVGTPAYAAPETGTGEVQHAADVYALGGVAWWLLTGETVFRATDPMALLRAHRDDPVPALRDAAPLPVPDALCAVVEACLAKHPSDRPPSMVALAAALRAAGVPAWDEEQAASWWAEQAASATPLVTAGAIAATDPTAAPPPLATWT